MAGGFLWVSRCSRKQSSEIRKSNLNPVSRAQVNPDGNYSQRNATMGSTRIALRFS
jgi:hypothetical protein